MIASLHALGFRTAMLTGDNARTARGPRSWAGRRARRAQARRRSRPCSSCEAIWRGAHGGRRRERRPGLGRHDLQGRHGRGRFERRDRAADVALMADDLSRRALAPGAGAARERQNIVFSLLAATMIRSPSPASSGWR